MLHAKAASSGWASPVYVYVQKAIVHNLFVEGE